MTHIWHRVEDAQDRLRSRLENCFECWATRVVLRRPLLLIFSSLIVCAAFGVGLVIIDSETDGLKLWAPQTARAYKDWEYIEDTFGETPSSLFAYFDRGGENVLTYEVLTQTMSMHTWTTTECESDGLFWADICEKWANEGSCRTTNFLELWSYNQTILDQAAADGTILRDITSLGQAAIASFAAQPAYDENGLLVKATALSFSYLVNSDSDGNNFEGSWNDGIETTVDASVVQLSYFSERSFDDELERLVSADTTLFIIALIVITIYLSLTLGRRSLVESRVILAATAMINVGLGVVAGFGFASILNIQFNSISTLLPLIVLGVQVDDIIITVAAVERAGPGIGVSEDARRARLAKGIAKSGAAVTISSLTTVIALAIGTSSNLPGVVMFCAYGAFCFLFAYLVLVTFFYGCLELDERRIAANRLSFFPCRTRKQTASTNGTSNANSTSKTSSASEAAASNTDPNIRHESTVPTKEQHTRLGMFSRGLKLLQQQYAEMLLTPWVSAIVVLIFLGLTGASIGIASNISTGLDERDILPDDSYVLRALDVEDTYFRGRLIDMNMIVRNEDWNDPSVRTSVSDTLEAIAAKEYVASIDSSWNEAYEASSYYNASSSYLDAHFSAFVKSTRWQSEVACASSDCEVIKASRYWLTYRDPTQGSQMLKERKAMDSEAAVRGLVETFTFTQSYIFAEADDEIWNSILSSMGWAILAIFCIVLVFASVPVAVWVTVSVAMGCADLFLWMVIGNVHADTVSYVCLLMALGLAIDYSVHIGHAFDQAGRSERSVTSHPPSAAQAASHASTSASVSSAAAVDSKHSATHTGRPQLVPTNRERATEALLTMGASVIQGGTTTFLGILVIAFASSAAFRTLFFMLAGTCIFGVLHALVLLPVLLTYATPKLRPRADAAEKELPPVASPVSASLTASCAA